MTQPELLMAMLLLQQALFASLWLASAYLRLARQPALHWAGAAALVSGGVGMIVMREHLGPTWSLALPNLMILGGIASLRRGVQLFVRGPSTDLEQGIVLALGLALMLGIQLGGGGPRQAAVAGSALVAWTLLRTSWELRAGLRDEMGRRASDWCAVPTLVIGLLFTARSLHVLFFVSDQLGSIAAQSAQNVITSFAMMVFGLVINIMLLVMTILRLVQRLRYQSEHDVMTELLNRRAMERLMAAEMKRQARVGGTHALLSLDIDHFKRVNDGHGHGAGDEVLRRVARLLRASCRDTDHVARMGGEEFAVLLPDTSEEGAGVLAEHLLQQVRALDLDTVVPGLRVTVSMGLAVVASGSDAHDDVMLRLDQALYAAKRAGRDCLQLATTAAAASADAAAGAVDFAADHAVGSGLNRVST